MSDLRPAPFQLAEEQLRITVPMRSVLHCGGDSIVITSSRLRPNRWWRMCHWMLLGWWWEDLR